VNAVACQYAIVRFAPFVETGEFANVGIILLAPRAGFFGHELQTRRHARITRFFEEMDARTYKAAVSTVGAEMKHFEELVQKRGFNDYPDPGAQAFAQDIFREIIRPREGIVRYSDPRVVMAEDPAATLHALFEHYVERSFATREYQEAVIERGLRMLLQRARLAARFENRRVGDEGFHVTFPLVETRDEVPVKAIKALNLAQADPSKIRDHAILWRARVDKLRARQALPRRVLFALSEPGPEPAQREAYEEAKRDLETVDIQLIRAGDQKRVLEFASA
jgi:hypothetical protein